MSDNIDGVCFTPFEKTFAVFRRRCCSTSDPVAHVVRIILTSLACLIFSGVSLADPEGRAEPVYGAGPSTPIATLFFQHFDKRPGAAGMTFTVPQRSTKHGGGIRASGEYRFGRTGRPLTEEEKAQGKFEIFLGKIPIGFATGPDIDAPPMIPSDIEAIFSGRVTNWKEVGGPDAPIVLVGRERTEAILTALSERFPSLLDADYRLVLKRDHAVVNFLASPAGKHAIGFGALSNFGQLNVVSLAGPPLGVNVGLVVDEKNRTDPVVEAARRFADSREWRRIAEGAGYLVADRAEDTR